MLVLLFCMLLLAGVWLAAKAKVVLPPLAKRLMKFVAVPIGFFYAAAANATIDVSTVVSGIEDASTAVLAIVAALMALSVSIYGVVLVWRFIHKKSGA